MLPLFSLLILFASFSHGYYVSHKFSFPSIPYSAGIFHIHSPAHFLEAHGFALPGFKIVETQTPRQTGDYVIAGFCFTTHFTGKMSARLFSSSLNSSHVVLMDPDGVPCLLGRLYLERCSSRGHRVCAHADLLRPASVWERMFGGGRLVKESEVERSIKVGYSKFKNDLNLARYVNMVQECNKKKRDST